LGEAPALSIAMEGCNVMVPSLPRSGKLQQQSALPFLQVPGSAPVVPPLWDSVRDPAVHCNSGFQGGSARLGRPMPVVSEPHPQLTEDVAKPDTGATVAQADASVWEPTPFLAVVERERADRDFALECLEKRVMAEVKSLALDRSSSQYLLSAPATAIPHATAIPQAPALPQAPESSQWLALQEAVAKLGRDFQSLQDKFASARIVELGSDVRDLRVEFSAESARRVIAERTTVGELSSLRMNLDALLESLIGDPAAEGREPGQGSLDLHAKLWASDDGNELAMRSQDGFGAASHGAAFKDFGANLTHRIARQCRQERQAHSEEAEAELRKRITEQCELEVAASFEELKEVNARMSERLVNLCKDLDTRMSGGVNLESHVAEIGQALSEHLAMHRRQDALANKVAARSVEQDHRAHKAMPSSRGVKLDLSPVESRGTAPGALHSDHEWKAPFENRGSATEDLLQLRRSQKARMMAGIDDSGLSTSLSIGSLDQAPLSVMSSRSSFAAMTIYSPSFCDNGRCASVAELQSVELEYNFDEEEAHQAAQDAELMRAIVAQHQKTLQRGHVSRS